MASENAEKLDSMIHRTFRDCKIEEKIAVGGFGTVYKALDLKLGVPRAIKIFHPHLSQEKGFVKRFEAEMKMLAFLDHTNIVRIMSAIDEPDASGFIMEFIEGRTLSDILEQEGALPIPKAIEIFTQVASAIGYAHNLKKQVIHRDLSPDNIMIRPDGVVKIMDFGIAKALGAERVTQTGIVLGKPTYMAPEQFEGTVSIYTDQYALGIILFEMLTLRVPFEADSPIALYKLHLNQPPVAPSELNNEVPKYIDKVILKSLAKDEKDRFQSVDEMLEKLLNKGQETRAIVDSKIPSLLAQTHEALTKEDFDKAIDCLNEILSYDPNNQEALAKRTEVLQLKKTHKDQEAIEEWFYQAQEFHKSNMLEEAQASIVDFLKIARQYKSSRIVADYQNKLKARMPEIFAKAFLFVEEQWKIVEKYTIEGKTLYQKDAYEEALMNFEKALEIDPHSEILQKLQKLTQRKIKMAKIAADYKEGILAIKNEEFQKALDCFDRILKLSPTHKEAKKYREIASAEMERIRKTRSEVEAAYQEALDLYEKWEFTQAIEKFERVIQMDDHHEQARTLLSESKSRVDDENKIADIGLSYNEGLTFYKSKQWDKAIVCFNRVLKYMDSHKGALEYKHLAEEKIQLQAQIAQSYETALELYRNSEYAQALEIFNFILAHDKNHKGAKQFQGLCMELQGFGPAPEETKSAEEEREEEALKVVNTTQKNIKLTRNKTTSLPGMEDPLADGLVVKRSQGKNQSKK